MKTVFCFLLVLPAIVYSSLQRVAVKGKLLCGDKPFSGALVKLIDKNSILPDTTMDKVTTKDNGTFYVDGKSSGVTTIDPQLKIYHDCDDKLVTKPCQRRWMFKIPDQYVNSENAKDVKVMNVGVFNLELRVEDEKRDCIH